MRNLLIAATLGLGATTAYAQVGPDAYVGAGVTETRFDNVVGSGNSVGADGTGWKAFVGVRPIAPFAIEADYLDLWSDRRHFGFDTPSHIDAHAFAAYGVGFLPLPLPFIDVFAKAGAARWSAGGNDRTSFLGSEGRGTEFAWGLGAQAHFGALGLRLEYEQFNVPQTSDVKAITFDAIFHFL